MECFKIILGFTFSTNHLDALSYFLKDKCFLGFSKLEAVVTYEEEHYVSYILHESDLKNIESFSTYLKAKRWQQASKKLCKIDI